MLMRYKGFIASFTYGTVSHGSHIQPEILSQYYRFEREQIAKKFSCVLKVLCKNRYVGRSFIQPTTRLRQLAVARKFGPYVENIVGKRIVLVDDSIVRGTTMQPMVALLRSCGAKEVRNFVLHPVCTSLYTWQ